MVYSKKVGGLPMFHFRRALNVAIGEREGRCQTLATLE
jgi:hypothetical protein